MGQEQLYYLWDDPLTRRNLIGSPGAAKVTDQLRRMFLDFLNTTPGTPEAKEAYLTTFRQELAAVVHRPPAKQVASADAPPAGRSNVRTP